MSDSAALAARLSAHMAAHGLKTTQQRQVILEVFLEAGEHLALDELLLRVQERKAGVGYATIYRTMKLFVEAGVAQERRFGDGQTRFEVAELGDDHHDHLICETCGHIFEFEDDEIERRQAAIAGRHGLRIKRHRLDIWGDCLSPGTCRFREEQERAAAG
jgi:Fur family transcriptional regulator, ferric uptake regulator